MIRIIVLSAVLGAAVVGFLFEWEVWIWRSL
mgnify:FL=1